MMIESDIIGYEELYKIDTNSNIYNKRTQKYMKKQTSNNGYELISLTKQKRKKTFLVHRLVAKHFIQNVENKREINHIDGDKKNNCFVNLEWCNRQENIDHCWNTGLITLKFIELQKQFIDLYKKGYNSNEIGKKFNISGNAVIRYLRKAGIQIKNYSSLDKSYCKKKIYQLNMNEEIINKWDGIRQMCRELGLTRRNVYRVLNKEKKYYNGFIFRYAKEE